MERGSDIATWRQVDSVNGDVVKANEAKYSAKPGMRNDIEYYDIDIATEEGKSYLVAIH
jgi:uncharacterized protein YacL (UPF0231 family)